MKRSTFPTGLIVSDLKVPRSTVLPVQGWVWKEEGVIGHPPPPPPHTHTHTQHAAATGRWWEPYFVGNWQWFWFIAVTLIVFAAIMLFFFPFRSHYHYVTLPVDESGGARFSGSGGGRSNCTTDETFDVTTQMCMMISHYPQAIAPSIVDNGVAPCTDMYRHACGKWMDEHVNENRGFSGLAALNGAIVRRIVLDETVANLNPFYQSCKTTLVDTQTSGVRRKMNLDDTRLTQLAILGRMLEPLVSLADLPIVFGRMAAAGYTVPVSMVIQGHPKDKGLVPMFTYDGFSAADQDSDWVRMHFALIYGDDAQKTDDETNSLVAILNRLNVMRPDREGATETYQGWKQYVQDGGQFDRTDSMTWDTFVTSVCPTSRFDWNRYVLEMSTRLGLPELKFNKNQPVWAFSRSYFEWFDPSTLSVAEWKTFVTFSVLYHTHDFFPEIPSDVLLRRPVNVHSPLRKGGLHRRLKKRRLSPTVYGYKRIIAARRKRQSRGDNNTPDNGWHKYAHRRPDSQHRHIHDVPMKEDGDMVVTVAECISASKYMLPGILSKEFLKRSFGTNGEKIRVRVKKIVESIRDRFVKNLLATEWMDEATRSAQADKIRAIIPRVVQPTEWMEEQFPLGREMDPLRYLRNLGIIKEDRVKRNLALWSESNAGVACDTRCRDRITMFGAPLFTVNAWYNPDRNVITVPAGILQPPFYHDQYTDASAYGTIGWVVAHELSHAEDANGILYDKNGLMRPTWSNDSLTQFRKRAQCIVREYGSPEGCSNDNYGEQTLSEDIADNNGLRLAYEALFLDNTPSMGPADLLASKKEFFMAAAQMWCASYTPDVLCDNARDDVHAIASMRVRKTMAHNPYFAEAHKCPAGSPMHREQCERCVFYGDDAKTACAPAAAVSRQK